MTSISAPRFFSSSSGVLPVQISRQSGGAVLRFFTTDDGGQSWNPTGASLEVRRGGSIFDGELALASFVDASNWYVLGDSLMVTRDGGNSFSAVAGNRDVADASQIQFTSVQEGWVKITTNPCSGSRDLAEARPSKACPTQTQVLRTSDAGKSWIEQPLG